MALDKPFVFCDNREMAYRTSAREEQDSAPEVKGDALTRIEVSGRPGLTGAHGQDGAHGTYPGSNGQSGRPAGPAEVGQDAGVIQTTLAPDPSSQENVLIRGNYTTADGNRKRLSRTVAIGEAGFIDLIARGGHGGHGGTGGNGGNGARGTAGSDASRYSSGGDGGPGGTGGYGGNGTNGANGGSGGAIITEVAREDTHLLMLLRYGVDGGPGGAAGSNGAGGAGGSGGPGGSSYSWTESESYTDSDGNQQTRTTSHSNPGGSDGPPGNPGMPGTAFLVPGQSGSVGSFVIHVTSDGQTESYPERYDLRLLGFKHHSDNDDGIYEPDELIHITEIEVMNVGAMPTPATRKVELSLREQGWVYPEKEKLVMPFSLGAGQRHTFTTEKLTARLGAFHPSKPSDPLVQEEVVRHRAHVPDVRRDFTNYENHRSFELGRFLIRFPIEASHIESLYSLSPGQAARLRFTIKNTSTKPYGAKTELGRRITFRLFLHESEIGDEHILFFDDTGARIHLSRGFSREIPELLPGQSISIEGLLALAENAPFYRAGRMWLSLDLGSIADPTHPKPIQYRSFDVRVSRPFDKHALGDVLLVVNNRTSAADIEAWQALFSAMGLEYSVYDLSLEGGFDLGKDGKIAKDDVRDRTIVFLNQVMDTTNGERKSIHYASKEQLLEICAAGARVHVIGEPILFDRLLVPTFHDHTTKPSRALVPASSTYLVPQKNAPRERLSIGDAPIELEIPKWSVLGIGKPTEAHLQKVAESLHDRLDRLYPEQRHVLVTEFAPELAKDYFVASRWKMGRIAVHRSLDGIPTPLSATVVKGMAEEQQKRILHRDNILQFVLALPFSKKLSRLEALTHNMAARNDDDDSLAGSVVSIILHAIVIDLIDEQLEVLRRPWCQGSTPQTLRKRLEHLNAVVNKLYASRPGLPKVEARAALVHILSSVDFFARSQVSFWEWMPPFLFERRAPVLRGVTLGLIKSCMRRIFLGNDPKSTEAQDRMREFAAEVDAAVRVFDEKCKQAKKRHEWQGTRGAYARELFLAPLANSNFKRGTNVFCEAKLSIFSSSQYVELRSKDVQSASKRRVMMKRAATAKNTLLVDATCAELVARAKKD
ncbi:MAG TPA: hypothetical protein PK156_03580 [Polyangium sp.]|nr:hypothetical protein [Polyangium sp.]